MSVCLRVCVWERERDRAIEIETETERDFKELARVIMEAGESGICSSSLKAIGLETREGADVAVQVLRRPAGGIPSRWVLGRMGSRSFILVRSSTDWMRPTHIYGEAIRAVSRDTLVGPRAEHSDGRLLQQICSFCKIFAVRHLTS